MTLWESGNLVLKLWNNVRKKYVRKACPLCRSRDTDIHIIHPFIVVACWDCGSAHRIAKLNNGNVQ